MFNHEKVCEEEFELLNDDLREKQFKAQFYGGIMGPIMGNSSQVCYGVTDRCRRNSHVSRPHDRPVP